MERDRSRFNSTGRRDGKAPTPKPIKHKCEDRLRCVKFEVFALRELTPDEVAAAVKDWLGVRKVEDLTPWRTYRIQLDEEE